MSTVYIPHRNPSHDYMGAIRFGNLHFITEGLVDSTNVGEIIDTTVSGLADAGPDDYLMYAGLPVQVNAAVAFLAAKYKRVRMLVFHANQGYSVQVFDFR